MKLENRKAAATNTLVTHRKCRRGPGKVSGEHTQFGGNWKTGKACLEAQAARGCCSVRALSIVLRRECIYPCLGDGYRRTLYSFPG